MASCLAFSSNDEELAVIHPEDGFDDDDISMETEDATRPFQSYPQSVSTTMLLSNGITIQVCDYAPCDSATFAWNHYALVKSKK